MNNAIYNGTLFGGAVIISGHLVLPTPQSYLQLPSSQLLNVYSSFGTLSLEAWVTTDTTPTWAKVFNGVYISIKYRMYI